MSSRIVLAFPADVEAMTLLIGADSRTDLSPFDPARTRIVQRLAPEFDALAAHGWQVIAQPDGPPASVVVVFLPRARAEGRARLAQAAAHLAPGGKIWVDGQKTDGVESALRELRELVPVDAVSAKAHGKIFRLRPPVGADWVPAQWADREQEAAPGFVTRAGVFSADGVDPGSALLALHLPERMPACVVDLGAGWGWLSAQVLARPGVERLHLVEADSIALDCARQNIKDPRAHFHWADATQFSLPTPAGAVVMNPPFHAGSRTADARIGAGFIAAAARLLGANGKLWMVANRHLPYEPVLAQHFDQFEEIGGDSRFKLIMATTGAGRPGRNRRLGTSAKGTRR